MKFPSPKKNYYPLDATIAITYHCNSRCKMCNIWQIENPPVLRAAAFENLSPRLRYLNLSGGEPFLHPELIDIVKTVNRASPKAKLIISTNGLAGDLIVSAMEKIRAIDPRVGVRISLDGREDMHDKIRGIPGIFRSALKTLRRLKEIGVDNIGFSFTLMDENCADLPYVYDLAKESGVEMAIALVQNSEIYFSKNDNHISRTAELEKSLGYVIDSELESFNPKKWARAFYDYGLLLYGREKKRLLPSGAGFDSLFIDPNGDIYPSNLIGLKIGNIKDKRLDDIWRSEQARSVREKIIKEEINESWIICTIRGQMRKNLPQVLFWVLANKLKLSASARLRQKK